MTIQERRESYIQDGQFVSGSTVGGDKAIHTERLNKLYKAILTKNIIDF